MSAGGGGGGEEGSRELDHTATWAVALVCLIIIIISILLEKTLHKVGEAFNRRKKFSLVEALEKIKAELMILGFISLLLTFGQSYISRICIHESVANTMMPCEFKESQHEATPAAGHHEAPPATGHHEARPNVAGLHEAPPLTGQHEPVPATGHREATPATGGHLEAGGQAATTTPVEHHRRLLQERRVLSADAPYSCKDGFEPLISVHALHQLHIFIFFLAVFHVFYGALTMTLGRLKIRGWKEWERQIIQETDANDPSRFRLTHETSFVKTHTSSSMQNPILLYIVSFFRHILYSVQRPDYFTLRHGFVSVHLSPGTKFDFQKYIKRSLEDDFKVVVGIPPHLWMVTVIYLLLNVKGGVAMFWLSIFPLVLILAVGTKLQSIIARMAIEIQEKHAVVQGIPLVQVSDEHFWFRKPTLVLHLIHLVLFQNAFELTYFFWIWYEFGLHSCFHRNFSLVIVRIIIGVGIQFLCSYITLPLYALVTQMGSHMKKSIFDEQTSKALKSWHNKAKKKDRPMPQTKKLGSPDGSPGCSPRRTVVDVEMSEK